MIRAALVSEGTSDRVLLPILRWVVAQQTRTEVEIIWADLRGLPEAKGTLAERVTAARQTYPSDLLFVHRDEDGQGRDTRVAEIRASSAKGTEHVCVVPVTMTEAWLLHDEAALREAAGRPTGRVPLSMPRLASTQALSDPKRRLHDLLRDASETSGRRRQKFRVEECVHRLAVLIDDWSALRNLSAFAELEADTSAALRRLGAVPTR